MQEDAIVCQTHMHVLEFFHSSVIPSVKFVELLLVLIFDSLDFLLPAVLFIFLKLKTERKQVGNDFQQLSSILGLLISEIIYPSHTHMHKHQPSYKTSTNFFTNY